MKIILNNELFVEDIWQVRNNESAWLIQEQFKKEPALEKEYEAKDSQWSINKYYLTIDGVDQADFILSLYKGGDNRPNFTSILEVLLNKNKAGIKPTPKLMREIITDSHLL